MPCVSYPGAAGAFAHQAAQAAFPRGCTLIPFESWEEAALAIVTGQCQMGVFPMDNSLVGEVPLTHKILKKYPLKVVKEHSHLIHQCLLALPGAKLEDIRAVTSHPHAIKQCTVFLSNHPYIKVIESDSTALSAMTVAKSNSLSMAAICSCAARDIYGLEVLEEDIQDSETNQTRFVVLERKDSI